MRKATYLFLLLMLCVLGVGCALWPSSTVYEEFDEEEFVSESNSLDEPLPTVTESTFLIGDKLENGPELAARGPYQVGVQTREYFDPGRPDLLNASSDGTPLYDRPLTVEIWYPAIKPETLPELNEYNQVMGLAGQDDRPIIPFTFWGRAVREAEPLLTDGPYPLVIVSHGYPGSRLMFTYLTENLASKGYVVVSIDHTDSTYLDADRFTSTLLNRAKDALFILDTIDAESRGVDFLAGLVDADNTALIGYSMGGYGVLNAAGAGYSSGGVSGFRAMTAGNASLEDRKAGDPDFEGSRDDRIKAVVAFAPWGMQRGLWDDDGLQGLAIPVFLVAGSEDDISGYALGTKAIYEGVTNAERYLLTYEGARHNVAPNPPPPESQAEGIHPEEYNRYAEELWDERYINNVNQHFLTAFLGVHLKGEEYSNYLESDNWPGFAADSTEGLELLRGQPAGQ